jgi:heme exporter protein CcmB
MILFCFYEIVLNFVTITTTFFTFSLYSLIVPLILGLWQELLQTFHLGVFWTCLLFSFLPEKFYAQDFLDGTLEFYYLNRFVPFNLILFSKLIGYWLLKICGILLSYPALSLFYQFELSIITCFSLIVGSFIFMLICNLHSCLTISIQKIQGVSTIHYLTTLPTLLPLILLCNYIQTETTHFFFLIGLATFYLSILAAFASHIFKNIIAL